MSTSNDRLRLIWRFRSFNTGVEQPPGTNVIGITTNNLGAPNDLKAIQPTSLILPVEIWLSILEHSDSARDKLKAITALSKLFRLTFFPMFRRIAHLDISRVPSSSIGIPNEHRRLVLDLTIACSNRLTGMEFSTAVAAHFLSFNEFSNLVSFNWAVSRPLPGGMYLILRSSPVLRSLMISSGPQRISSTSGFLDLAPPRCQLTTAGVGKAHVVGDIFRPGAPSRSSITTLVVFHSKLIYCLSPTLTLSSLVILDIRCTLKYSSVSALFHLLSSTPTLEHLSLCEGSPYCDIDSSTRDATACPFLKSVTDLAWIPSVFMPLLYGKRTLERLELVGPLLAADVKRIHWQSLRVVDITFSHPDVEGKLVEVIEGGGTVNWTDVTFRANDWRPATSHDDLFRRFLVVMASRVPRLAVFHLVRPRLIDSQPEPKDEELFGEDICVFREVLRNNPKAFPSWEVFKMSFLGFIEWVKFTPSTCEVKPKEAMEVNTRYTPTGWIGTFERFDVEVLRRRK